VRGHVTAINRRAGHVRTNVRRFLYGFALEQLTGAVDRLAADTALRERLDAVSRGIRSARAYEGAAELIAAAASVGA